MGFPAVQFQGLRTAPHVFFWHFFSKTWYYGITSVKRILVLRWRSYEFHMILNQFLRWRSCNDFGFWPNIREMRTFRAPFGAVYHLCIEFHSWWWDDHLAFLPSDYDMASTPHDRSVDSIGPTIGTVKDPLDLLEISSTDVFPSRFSVFVAWFPMSKDQNNKLKAGWPLSAGRLELLEARLPAAPLVISFFRALICIPSLWKFMFQRLKRRFSLVSSLLLASSRNLFSRMILSLAGDFPDLVVSVWGFP